MSRTYRRMDKTFKTGKPKNNIDDSKTELEEFLREYEQKNNDPYIHLRSI